MPLQYACETLDRAGLIHFQRLSPEAVTAVTDRFYALEEETYGRMGPRGRQACQEDLSHHLEFLRPALEFGLLHPLIDYLQWVENVLEARGVPGAYLDRALYRLGEYFAAHMPDGEGQVVAAALTEARRALRTKSPYPGIPFQRSPPSADVDAFLAALLAGDQLAALAVVDRCLDQGHDLVDVERHVIEPAMCEIGDQWQANRLTAAAEHMATSIVQSVMTLALLRTSRPPKIGRQVVLACVEGNQHSVGLRMVADAFVLAGWEVEFLGANVPTSALVRHIVDRKPQLVGLSVSLASHLQAVTQVIDQLIERLGDARPSVLIGGLAVNRFDQLAGKVGADTIAADGRSAVASAQSSGGR